MDIFSSFSFLGRPSTENPPSFYLPSYTYTRTMSDHEVETFESTDAGASKTVPMQAGSVRKGGYIVIKGKACKVLLRLVVGFEKMNRDSRDRVLSRRESRAFYARFERAYIHRSRSESFRWGTEPFAARFARRCAQKSPLYSVLLTPFSL